MHWLSPSSMSRNCLPMTKIVRRLLFSVSIFGQVYGHSDLSLFHITLIFHNPFLLSGLSFSQIAHIFGCLLFCCYMAQLPPKIPSMTQNWHSSSHQRMPINMSNFVPINNNTSSSTSMPTSQQQQQQQQQQPSWVDEFLDFSSARRGAHRRSMSDSIAFLETAPFIGVECRNNGTGGGGFDRLDDDQLMSMFSDEVLVALPPTVSSSNASTPSDHNSIDDENKPIMPLDQQPKSEPGEVESSCKPEPQDPVLPSTTPTGDSIVDPKRVKRILANRQSAQRSRVRKLQYISELERSVTTLQTEVSALSPRVAFLDHQRLILNVDNSALKQRIAAMAQDNIFKDAHQEALKKEIERLRQIYHQQNLKMMSSAANQNAPPPTSPSQAPQPLTPDHYGGTDKERLLN